MRKQLTALALASALPGCLAATPLLTEPTNINVGLSPASAIPADINGDGKPDLVVTRTWTRGEISVLMGNGDGTFGAPIVTSASGVAKPPCIADFNGDGKLDLAVSDMIDGGFVSILLGNGDGTFRQPSQLVAGKSPSSPKAADLNGDGKLDLLLVNFRPEAVTESQVVGGRLTVMLGNGDGTFTAGRARDIDGSPNGVAVGDWDGDGKPDVAIADESRHRVLVLRGNGDGSFSDHHDLRPGFEPISVSAADLNKDNKLDLVVGVRGGVVVYFNDGATNFQRGKAYVIQRAGSVSVADFDHDGTLDLVSATRILVGDGAGDFKPVGVPHGGRDDAFVVAADLNGDGWPDMIATDSDHNRISIYLNQGGHGAASAKVDRSRL